VPSPTPTSLERRLGPFDAAAIIVANVIGAGILFTPPFIASMVPHPMWFLSTWLAGGVLAFFGAMAYAELAALRPRAGGEYVYLREAYGPLAGFMTGWTSFVAGFAGAMAASAIFLIFLINRFIPGVADSTPFFVIPLPYVPMTFSRHTLMAIIALWLFAFVHVVGVGPGRVVLNVLVILKVTALIAFIALGFAIGTGSGANFQQGTASISLTNWLLALVPVMFTYSGWNAAAYMAEEIREPGRNVPRALLMGTVAVIIIYALLNALYLYAMPVGELAAVKGSVFDLIGERILGARAGDLLAVIAIVSVCAGLNAWTFAGPRVYYAMARDGVFFPAASRVHPRFKTPHVSIMAQAAWASVLILTGSLDTLSNYVGFAITLFAGIAVAAVFVLRAREPHAPRPYRTLGYPIAPGIFVLASLAIVLNAFYRNPGPSSLGLLVIGAGIPLYMFLTRGRRR
jgi:basic amino acid/polyamine antiporter, APA family